MRISSNSGVQKHYSGFIFMEETNPPREASTTIAFEAQLGHHVKGSIKVNRCFLTAVEAKATAVDQRLDDYLSNYSFSAEIKSKKGELELHSTLPKVGKFMKMASCSYSTSNDFKLTTSEDLEIAISEEEKPISKDNVSYSSTSIENKSYLDSYLASPVDGSVFHVKANNVKNNMRFIRVNYPPFVVPAHIEPIMSSEFTGQSTCDLTTTNLSGEDRIVQQEKITVTISGNFSEGGLFLDWNYNLPKHGAIVDVEVRCPDLAMKAYAEAFSQWANFGFIDSDKNDWTEDDIQFESVGFTSGALASSLLSVVGLLTYALAMLL